jgi:hypothetical protein
MNLILGVLLKFVDTFLLWLKSHNNTYLPTSSHFCTHLKRNSPNCLSERNIFSRKVVEKNGIHFMPNKLFFHKFSDFRGDNANAREPASIVALPHTSLNLFHLNLFSAVYYIYWRKTYIIKANKQKVL